MSSFAAFRSLAVLWGVSSAYAGLFVLAALFVRANPLGAARFSLRRFYALMGWAPLAFVALAFLVDSRYLSFFFVAGFAGIVGELIVSLYWRRYFREPIWTYSYRSVLKGYTSTLNFLPWAVGALLFCEAGQVYGAPSERSWVPILTSALALAVGSLIGWPLRRWTSARDGTFTPLAFAVFCLPIALTALALGFVCWPAYPLLMAAFALLGFTTEYAYGRSMSLFFERGLWTYNHWKIDDGHTSFVTLPLWALGGLYFHFIAVWLGV